MATLKELILECECCYSDTPEKALVNCPVGHTFCQQCVRTATSVAMGEGKTVIKCMVDCREEINWQQLGMALEPNVLFKLEQKRQAEEVDAAGLDSLVACPFCPYQTVMEDSHDKVLICRNPECGKDSCRQCKEPSHIPLRCDELPQVEGARKKIEEELSLAMLRKCWQCKKMFYKEVEEVVRYFNDAIKVLNKMLDTLKADTFNARVGEIDELEKLIPEIREKIEDTIDSKEETSQAKKMRGDSSSGFSSSDMPASSIEPKRK